MAVGEALIPDDEPLLRRVPPGTRWFAPPDRITSANFVLREGEGAFRFTEPALSPRKTFSKSRVSSRKRAL